MIAPKIYFTLCPYTLQSVFICTHKYKEVTHHKVKILITIRLSCRTLASPKHLTYILPSYHSLFYLKWSVESTPHGPGDRQLVSMCGGQGVLETEKKQKPY